MNELQKSVPQQGTSKPTRWSAPRRLIGIAIFAVAFAIMLWTGRTLHQENLFVALAAALAISAAIPYGLLVQAGRLEEWRRAPVRWGLRTLAAVSAWWLYTDTSAGLVRWAALIAFLAAYLAGERAARRSVTARDSR